MSKEIIDEAFAAAREAAETAIPHPMIVGQATGLFGSGMVPGTEEYVSEGLCGFAWVNIKPARGPLIKYCKQNKIGHPGTYGGWSISMGSVTMSQSIERKECAADAFVKVLQKYGVERCWKESRLD